MTFLVLFEKMSSIKVVFGIESLDFHFPVFIYIQHLKEPIQYIKMNFLLCTVHNYWCNSRMNAFKIYIFTRKVIGLSSYNILEP